MFAYTEIYDGTGCDIYPHFTQRPCKGKYRFVYLLCRNVNKSLNV